MRPNQAPYGRAAARIGLLGGLLLAAIVIAQQWTPSSELNCFGTLLALSGMITIGWYAAREAGARERLVAQRAGMLAGLLAGITAGLAVSALFLVIAVGPISTPALTELQTQVTPDMIKSQLDATYGATQADRMLQQSGLTLDEFAGIVPRMTIAISMACCGLGLPLAGGFFGSVGGALGRSDERPGADDRRR